jgi:hypothetical protein
VSEGALFSLEGDEWGPLLRKLWAFFLQLPSHGQHNYIEAITGIDSIHTTKSWDGLAGEEI